MGAWVGAGTVEAPLIMLGVACNWSMGDENWEAAEAELIPDCRSDSSGEGGEKNQ